MPLSPATLRRRAAMLCLHFSRNLAFFRAGWHENHRLFPEGAFWVANNGNAIDICVLEWYKLFGDQRGKHYWKKLVTDEADFQGGLLHSIGLNQTEYDHEVQRIKRYRDKFVAHLDEENTMEIPEMETARKSVFYLYDYLFLREGLMVRPPLIHVLRIYYEVNLSHAEKFLLVN